MRIILLPFVLTLLITQTGCTAALLGMLADEPIVEEKVEYIKQEVDCGVTPQVDKLHLKAYEPIVLPSLAALNVSIENLPEYLVDHYDHGWMALSMADWEDIDTNDIDKKRLTMQWMAVVDFYQECISKYKVTEESDDA